MKNFSRRGFIALTGAALLARELFYPPKATANFDVTSDKDVALCKRHNGKVHLIEQYEGGHKKYCETNTPEDEACSKTVIPGTKGYKYEYYNQKTGKCDSTCFLTTACVHHVGLTDDCFELTTLRLFRDKYVRGMPGGEQIVQHYYKTAPRIVRSIANSPNAGQELSKLYVRYILPTVWFYKLGHNALAYRTYTAMITKLSARYC